MSFQVSRRTNSRGNNLRLGKVSELGTHVRWVEVDSLLCLADLEANVILLNHGIEELRKVMRLGMFGDTRDSKRAIQHLAQETLGGRFSVICTTGDISYVVQTSFFCLETYNDLTCYAFQSE